jgi:nucleoside-diphosphate-sugar epimerase
MKKILVIGGAGYIGSVLLDELLKRNYNITCLDKCYFGKEHTRGFVKEGIEFIDGDMRNFNSNLLDEMDVVINLAAISQPDPKGMINKSKFWDLNYLSAKRVACLSKLCGVEKLIFASTCSVYGFQEKVVDENSQLNPIEIYGKTKATAEKEILSLADDDFCITALRFATVYGLSPKMRYDLIVNGMTLALFKNGKITVMRDGNQIRPNVHVRDVANAIIKTIESNKNKVNGEVFNVGSNEQNYPVLKIAEIIGDAIKEEFGIDYEIEWYGDVDTRSYCVNFDKINKVLGFKTQYTPKDGAIEIYGALKGGIIKDEDKSYVIKQYKSLQDNGVI